MKKQKYYQMVVDGRTANINIYGDITSWPFLESDVTSFDIKKQIDNLDVDDINIYINSYGGEVAEALAIYSALKRNKANVHTFCDGFACSAASIVFCAGDVRTMGAIALLMIHNCMSYIGLANSDEMRKAAEDNDKINQSSIEAYKAVTGLEESKIKKLMDAATWLTAEEALELGFATDIAEPEESEEPQQSAFGMVRDAVLNRPIPGSAEIQKWSDSIDKCYQIALEIQQGIEKTLEAVTPVEIPEPKESEKPENKANIFLTKLVGGAKNA